MISILPQKLPKTKLCLILLSLNFDLTQYKIDDTKDRFHHNLIAQDREQKIYEFD